MKLKQYTINKLISEIQNKIKNTGKEVVEYSIDELLESLNLTDIQIDYAFDGIENFLYNLSHEKQFDWNKIGCLPMYDHVYFITYKQKTNEGHFEVNNKIFK